MLTELRTLIAIAKLGTFTLAGDRVGLTQTAVSGQMKRLETQLGRTLFLRTGRSATLNAAGHLAVERALEIVALADALIDPASEKTRQETLRIGAIASAQLHLVRAALPIFREQFPHAQVQIIPGTSLELIDRLDADDLDLALVIAPRFWHLKTLLWSPLTQEPFVMVAPIDTSVESWQAAAALFPFIRYDRQSFGGREVAHFLEHNNVSVQDWVELDDIPSILAMVQDGLGISIVPRSMAYKEQFKRLAIIELGDPTFLRTIGTVYSRKMRPLGEGFLSACRLSESV